MNVAESIARLEADGYCRLPGIYDPARLRRALDLVDEWWGRTQGRVTRDLPEMAKDPVVWNLQNKSFFFLELLFASEHVERVLVHFLNDAWYRRIPKDAPNYILRAYVARSGLGPLPLHIDSFVPYRGEHVLSMQCAIVLENMTARTGATTFVPGSHLSGRYAEQSELKHAVPVEAEAGDVLLWDSRVWHGANPNPAAVSRWLLIATFTRWWVKQAFDVTGSLPAEFYERLDPKGRAVLGYCSIPHADEFEGIVTQRGYDALPETKPGGAPRARK